MEVDRTVYLRNITEDITESILYELFLQAGPVESVTVKGNIAFVTFEDEESVPYSCCLFEGLQLCGSNIVVRPRAGSKFVNTRLHSIPPFTNGAGRPCAPLPQWDSTFGSSNRNSKSYSSQNLSTASTGRPPAGFDDFGFPSPGDMMHPSVSFPVLPQFWSPGPLQCPTIPNCWSNNVSPFPGPTIPRHSGGNYDSMRSHSGRERSPLESSRYPHSNSRISLYVPNPGYSDRRDSGRSTGKSYYR